MKGLSFNFMALGVIFVTIGMAWGIHMSASADHTMAPAHAHLNLLGFVLFSIYAFYYHLVPTAAESTLAKVHFGLALAGVVIVVPGIVMALNGTSETFAKIGSILTLLSMLSFLAVVFKNRG